MKNGRKAGGKREDNFHFMNHSRNKKPLLLYRSSHDKDDHFKKRGSGAVFEYLNKSPLFYSGFSPLFFSINRFFNNKKGSGLSVFGAIFLKG